GSARSCAAWSKRASSRCRSLRRLRLSRSCRRQPAKPQAAVLHGPSHRNRRRVVAGPLRSDYDKLAACFPFARPPPPFPHAPDSRGTSRPRYRHLSPGLLALPFLFSLCVGVPAQPPPAPNPQAPPLAPPVPLGMTPGTPLDLTLTGTNLAEPTGL